MSTSARDRLPGCLQILDERGQPRARRKQPVVDRLHLRLRIRGARGRRLARVEGRTRDGARRRGAVTGARLHGDQDLAAALGPRLGDHERGGRRQAGGLAGTEGRGHRSGLMALPM